MNFDDIMREDMGAVFLSLDEFGREIEIDEVTVTGILDDGDTREQTIKGVPEYGVGYGDRMWAEKKTLYVREEDIQPVPKATQEIYVNGTQYEVVSVSNEDGLVTILMEEIGV